MKDSFKFYLPILGKIFNVFLELFCNVRAELQCGSILETSSMLWGLEPSRFEFPTGSTVYELCDLRQVAEPL